MLQAISRLKFKYLAGILGWPLRQLVRGALQRELSGVSDVSGFQSVVEAYMSRMIEESTEGFTVSGLDQLADGKPCLLMSNHRDITLDPAFTSYALFHNGLDTVRIAIGDNLLTKQWVSDLMRLNKSFIVKRSAMGPREVFKAYRQLSAYIRHSIQVERVPIWIAQREGRAKDGIDKTEPAIIKMLAMSKEKQEGFGDFIASLRIVPVSISYELDPCDALKAAELHALASSGEYHKAEHEDVASIAVGISGAKGQVHVAFGEALGGEHETPEAVAAEVDRQIIANYQLHATSVYAWRRLHGGDEGLPAGAGEATAACSEAEFNARIDAMPAPHREKALGIYANAISSKLGLARGNDGLAG